MLCVAQLKCYTLGSVINADTAFADAAFANVSTAVACRIYIYGMHFTGLVKTTTTKLPMDHF